MRPMLAAGNDANPIPSSSPAFGTPAYPIRPVPSATARVAPTTPHSSKPAASLRTIAVRIFTRKHGLQLRPSASQALVSFIEKNYGTEGREEGLAEKVLEEVARLWKKSRGSGIVDGADPELMEILKGIQTSMVGGKAVTAMPGQRTAPTLVREDSVNASQMETLSVSTPLSTEVQQESEDTCQDPRKFLKVVSLFDQPRLFYDPSRRHFEKISKAPSLLPDPSQKTKTFRDRYHLVQQRILRNESFQAPTIQRGVAAVAGRATLSRTESSFTQQTAYTLTPIHNLLGRAGSNHVLLGLLTTLPTGQLAISDLTGSIILDLSRAVPVPRNGSWFVPGMIVIVEGSYHEEDSMDSVRVGGGGGVGGTIGGKFAAASIGGPPSERREISIGISDHKRSDQSAGAGFGWVDFLGVGSEKSFGSKMRSTETHIWRAGSADSKRSKMVCIGELNLDNEQALKALRRILSLYAAAPAEDMPMTFVLAGNFVTNATMAGGRAGGSIEYKECFDLLASVLSDYPTLLQAATFIFVPGDNDPWPSAFSSGATTAIPRGPVPEMFTSRIKRAFTTANADTDRVPSTELNGEAVWASNPTRLSLFGPVNELVIFRDDISSRLRRNSVRLAAEDESDEDENDSMDADRPERDLTSQNLVASRKLVKTILDQGHLCPFAMSVRPTLWDWASSLNLYPLPTAMLLIDPEAPAFAVTYEGCHVMNPGRLLAEGRRGMARWMEYDVRTKKGLVREELI